jgi:protein-tyrosine phosphatase
MASWSKVGVDEVVSLLTPDEADSLELQNEASHAQEVGMRFRSFPIVDRSVPNSKSDALRFIETLDADLASGVNVSIHCRQGVGRAGLIAASLLISRGLGPAEATERVSRARGVAVPETSEQGAWLAALAAELTRREPVA